MTTPEENAFTDENNDERAPVEDPKHEAYLRALEEERLQAKNANHHFQEIIGERVVPVHGQGIYAYSAEEQDEEIKRNVWRQHASEQHWLVSARRRRDYWATATVRPPLRWCLVEEGENLVTNALPTGNEGNGELLYSARSWLNGGLHVGKAGRHLRSGASISYGSTEYVVRTYEVLVGEPSAAIWMELPRGRTLDIRASPPTPTQALVRNNQQDKRTLSFIPVEGGREEDGKFLFVAQASYENSWQPCKAGEFEDHACVGYGGGEVWVRRFRLLAYAL